MGWVVAPIEGAEVREPQGEQLVIAGLAECLGGDEWWFVSCRAGDGPVVTRRRATPDRGGVGETSVLWVMVHGEGSLEVIVGLETIRRGLEANVMLELTTAGAALSTDPSRGVICSPCAPLGRTRRMGRTWGASGGRCAQD